jgi:hypothetical protein
MTTQFERLTNELEAEVAKLPDRMIAKATGKYVPA